MATVEQIIPDEWRELNRTQRDVMYSLAVCGPLTATELNATLGRPHAHHNTVSRALNDMRDLGYIATTDADDRPGTGHYHDLTDAGLDVIHNAPVRLEP